MYFPQTILGSTQVPPPLPLPLPSPSSSNASVEEAFNVVRAAEMLRKSQQMEAAASEAALVEARSALGSAIAREEAEEEDRRRWEQFEDAAAAAAIETARKMRRSSQGAAAQRAAEVTNILRSLPISAFRMLVFFLSCLGGPPFPTLFLSLFQLSTYCFAFFPSDTNLSLFYLPSTLSPFPPYHFFSSPFRLREKGAITLNGEVMKPAMLTYQEEELIGNSQLLLKLVEHGVILPSY
jgi:hypothetical protein